MTEQECKLGCQYDNNYILMDFLIKEIKKTFTTHDILKPQVGAS